MMLRKLQERWQSWQLQRAIDSGEVLRGRQPEDGLGTKVPMSATMSAVVTRADGRVEDLGVIYKQEK